ncbi:MAG TPA: potassium-transporting ATPase subunit KdpA, partial [Bauldia sp.]|nr:potassium-transporting ATPase subunit KdpA [Bauldia sp.]
MTINGWLQIILYCVIVVALAKPLGGYMTRVFGGERTFLSPIFAPVERLLYGAAGIDEKHEQHWVSYAVAMLLFHVAGFVFLYALLRLQGLLPFNPQGMTA